MRRIPPKAVYRVDKSALREVCKVGNHANMAPTILRAAAMTVFFMLGCSSSLSAPCNTITGVVFGFGHDLPGGSRGKGSAAACCAACQSTPGCQSFNYHVSGQAKDTCHLHSSVDGVKSDPTSISGTPSGALPTIPPTAAPTPPQPSYYDSGVSACVPGGGFDHFPFCNTSMAIDERVMDLVKRIDDSAKPNLLTARGHLRNQGREALPKLGVPSYYW